MNVTICIQKDISGRPLYFFPFNCNTNLSNAVSLLIIVKYAKLGKLRTGLFEILLNGLKSKHLSPNTSNFALFLTPNNKSMNLAKRKTVDNCFLKLTRSYVLLKKYFLCPFSYLSYRLNYFVKHLKKIVYQKYCF